MKTYRIASIPGDGIGNEVTPAGMEVLYRVADGFALEFRHFDWSSKRYVETGRYIPEGGLEKLRGKKIAHIFHNSPYGKEANPTLEDLAKRYGFELTLLPVDSPGQEQKSTWLQVRRLNPDWIFMSGWGVMNQVAIKEAVAIGFKMDRFIGNWWSASDADVIPAGDRCASTSNRNYEGRQGRGARTHLVSPAMAAAAAVAGHFVDVREWEDA